ncbi:hypothetical protein PAUR_a1518 [Pseudoalteromonas aurantia 208]|uniref:Uncharacterized protein n=1 Tax=Pseudoalteromonas aurantia 208 TaxID=1314867 RepID=A0ABR9ECQ7_9GAMM|nr:hypothetical protein [Pseudoalteromonas aurantia 208]
MHNGEKAAEQINKKYAYYGCGISSMDDCILYCATKNIC